ncbi:MAG: L-threonylcarbamoyladenylate synthase [Betaproteobacteria bacterium]|nr:L-threonylcarbamoyladenylate synthase [Betaproteobacteria bacterium]
MNEEIRRAAGILRAGGLVAFPTETVYGLGADASNAQAIARLYAVKGRPAEHPVIVHFDTAARAFAWARELPEAAHALAAKFWPGPLTLIVRRAPHVGDFVTGAQHAVGLRVPAHPVARELLAAFAELAGDVRRAGIAAPSANRFGRVSPTTAAHVRADLGGEVDLVLEGGASEVGIESTIVDLTRARPAILRPGRVSAAQIEAEVGALDAAQGAPRHSGGLERHYAPRTPALLVASHAFDGEIARRRGRIAALAFSRPDERVALWLRMPQEPQAYAQRLYAALRELDLAGCDVILVEAPPETPEWAAVRDRLRRAAEA